MHKIDNPTTALLTTIIQELTKQKEYHEKHSNHINEKIESHNKPLKLIQENEDRLSKPRIL